MRTETLRFPGAQGAELAARVNLPVGRKPRGWALFAHCFTCSKDLKAVDNISLALNREGVAVFRFDFTGLGQSGGEFADTDFSSNVEDLVAAARFMETEYDAPHILVGHSLGGSAVLAAAAEMPSVEAVATIGAPFDPAHVKHLFTGALDEIESRGVAEVELAGRRFKVRKEFLENLEAQRARKTIASLGRPLLVFHSPVDGIVGIENARLIYEAAKHPKSFVSLDTADHLLTEAEDSRYVGSVLASWASRYALRPAPEEEPVEELRSGDRVVARTFGDALATDVVARDHALVADEPKRLGGEDLGPTPYDLVAGGLAACTTMTLRMYAGHKGWPLEEVIVRVRHTREHGVDCGLPDDEAHPDHLDHLDREVEIVGDDLTPEQRERLLEVAGRCPVHKTLTRGIKIRTEAAGQGG